MKLKKIINWFAFTTSNDVDDLLRSNLTCVTHTRSQIELDIRLIWHNFFSLVKNIIFQAVVVVVCMRTQNIYKINGGSILYIQTQTHIHTHTCACVCTYISVYFIYRQRRRRCLAFVWGAHGTQKYVRVKNRFTPLCHRCILYTYRKILHTHKLYPATVQQKKSQHAQAKNWKKYPANVCAPLIVRICTDTYMG